ncbi:hypothetical protein BJX70DRAFT_82592 [Aspergillus crustosus]
MSWDFFQLHESLTPGLSRSLSIDADSTPATPAPKQEERIQKKRNGLQHRLHLGKGPDIYVGRIRPRSNNHKHNRARHGHMPTQNELPERGWKTKTGWSLWEQDHLTSCRVTYCERCAQIRARIARDNRFAWARRHPDERYDYRMREYRVPDEGTWAGRVHCDEPGHEIPVRYWDRFGRGYPAGYWHDMVHGAHAGEDSGGHEQREWVRC